MASRADPHSPRLSGSPSLGGAIRTAAQAAYYHSWRLLPANVLWSAVALTIAALVLVAPAGLLLVPVLAVPTAGIFRVTTRIARGEAVSFWDAIAAWRTGLGPTLGLGIALCGTAAILGTNVVSGLSSGSPLGWGLATLAGWGLVAGWLYAWTAWPLLLDPSRAARPASQRLRLAGLLVLAHPMRLGSLGIALGMFLLVSAVAIVALATIAVAFAALVASCFVLPAADRFEARLATAAVIAGPAIGDTP